MQDNNSDGTECSTLVGTNNEPNKIKAINYSRSNQVTITCNGTTPNLLCYSKTLTHIATEKWKTSECNETNKTDFGVTKISQKQNRP